MKACQNKNNHRITIVEDVSKYRYSSIQGMNIGILTHRGLVNKPIMKAYRNQNNHRITIVSSDLQSDEL